MLGNEENSRYLSWVGSNGLGAKNSLSDFQREDSNSQVHSRSDGSPEGSPGLGLVLEWFPVLL